MNGPLPTNVTISGLLLCAGLCPGAVADLDVPLDADVRACVERVMPERSYSQRVTMTVYENDEHVNTIESDVYWKRMADGRSRALLRVTEPPHQAGLALLVVEPEAEAAEQEMFMYLPELRSTRRIVGSALAGSMFGSGFSYEDFALVQGMVASRAVRRLDDEHRDERVVYVIETSPAAATSQYARVVSHIDQAWCIPLALAFYRGNGELAKQVAIDVASLQEIDGRHIPSRLTLTDLVRKGRTDIEVLDIRVDPDLSDHLFSPSALERGR